MTYLPCIRAYKIYSIFAILKLQILINLHHWRLKMKITNILKVSSAALFVMATGLAQAGPATAEVFVHAEDKIQSTAACLVLAGNQAAISDCLCTAGGGAFSFCATGTAIGTIVHTSFVAAWAADIQSATTSLQADILGSETPGSLLVDARASCTLDQASLDLALSSASDASKLKGVIGAKAQYSAIYMYPTVNGVAVTGVDPVRLCGLGQASVIAAGTLTKKSHEYIKGGQSHSLSLNAGITATDLGLTGAFEWAIPTPTVDSLVGVKYVLIAGVGAAVIKAGGGITGIGVLANTKITDRSLHIETKNGLNVLDQNPIP